MSHNGSLIAILEVRNCIVAADVQNLKSVYLLNGKELHTLKLPLINCIEESRKRRSRRMPSSGI
jgi:hypothetical protein